MCHGESPEMFQIRIEVLINSKCFEYALNLTYWCVASPEMCDDTFFRKQYLRLLTQCRQYDRLVREVSAACLDYYIQVFSFQFLEQNNLIIIIIKIIRRMKITMLLMFMYLCPSVFFA